MRRGGVPALRARIPHATEVRKCESARVRECESAKDPPSSTWHSTPADREPRAAIPPSAPRIACFAPPSSRRAPPRTILRCDPRRPAPLRPLRLPMHTLIPLLAAALCASPDTAPAAPPSGDVLVVANQGDATVHLVEAATGRTLAALPSAPAPHEVAVTRDGRWAVATNYGDREAVGHALTVIDVATQTVARSIDLAPHTRPHGIAFLPGDSLLAVTSETSRGVLLVSFPGGELRGVMPTSQAGTHILAIAAGGGKVWTANVGSGTVTELDVQTRSPVRTITVGPGTEGAALTPDGRRIWAASMGLDSTYVFDTSTGARIAAISTPGHPYRVAISP